MHLMLLLACVMAGDPGWDGQERFERQVRQQLDAIAESLKNKGFELTHQIYAGALREDAGERVSLRLRRGVRYAIVGVCDEDCSDIDMRLFDPAEREIGRDVEKDDTPVVELVADKTGEYVLRVEMVECSEEPCAYGVGVFAAGQDEFDRQVRAQLEETARELSPRGFKLTHQIFTGALGQDEHEDVLFTLERGHNYVILGVCDGDCRDIDLALLDANGREVDRDVQDDDTPVVAVAPAATGRYTVRVAMAHCAKGPCRYGLGVFSRPGAAAGAEAAR